jgi:hypothetical protein
MASNIREDHEPIASEDNVLADAGTHVNEPKRALGFKAYLDFLSHTFVSRPNWWPEGFLYPPRASGFDRIDPSSTLGILGERISPTNSEELCFSREEVGKILRDIRLQLFRIANSNAI